MKIDKVKRQFFNEAKNKPENPFQTMISQISLSIRVYPSQCESTYPTLCEYTYPSLCESMRVYPSHYYLYNPI